MMSLYYKIHQRNICKTCSNEISKHEYHHDPRNMNKTHKIRVQLNKSNAQNNNENFIKVIKTLVLSHRKYEWMFQSHEHTVLCNGSIVNKIEKRIELDRIVRGRKGDETIETSFSFFVMFVWLLCLCVAFGLSYILISLYVCFIMIGVRIFDEWSACFHASIMIHSTTRNHVFINNSSNDWWIIRILLFLLILIFISALLEWVMQIWLFEFIILKFGSTVFGNHKSINNKY